MEFEQVPFDLSHGTFHALQGGDPDGQPTLVLHGFPDHPPTATPFLAELGRRGRHVVAPWLRGYAPSPTAGPFDLAALTSDVLAPDDRDQRHHSAAHVAARCGVDDRVGFVAQAARRL